MGKKSSQREDGDYPVEVTLFGLRLSGEREGAPYTLKKPSD